MRVQIISYTLKTAMSRIIHAEQHKTDIANIGGVKSQDVACVYLQKIRDLWWTRKNAIYF